MLNSIDIMGRLTKDPEVRYTAKQTPVCSFTIACDKDTKDDAGRYPADFFDCNAWNKLAEFVHSYFHKGDTIILNGRLEQHQWEDKNGNKRITTQIKVNNVYFGGRKSIATDEAPATTTFTEIADDDGDLPF